MVIFKRRFGMKKHPAMKPAAILLAFFLCFGSAFPMDMDNTVPRDNWRAVQLLEKGTSISVTMDSGDKMEGKFLELESNAIRLRVDNQERIYPRANVQEIRQLRVPDSRANGTLIGMGAGTVGGVIAASVSGTLKTGDTAGRQWGAGFIMAGMGFGALFGFLADTAIKGSKTIYRK
jgi:hypothetical protein